MKSLPNWATEGQIFQALVEDVYTEYVTERDKNEPGGQSPNDNSASGEEVLEALRAHVCELEYKPGKLLHLSITGRTSGPG